MTTVNQCEAYAAEYQARGTALSIQRATALMSISQSWTTLAGQLDRLAQIIGTSSALKSAIDGSATDQPVGRRTTCVGRRQSCRRGYKISAPEIPLPSMVKESINFTVQLTDRGIAYRSQCRALLHPERGVP